MRKSNRIPCLILACALMLGLAFSSAPVWAQADEVSAEVASVRGTVTVKRAASEKSFTAFTGLKLKQGDVVNVAAGGEVAINIGEDKTVKGLADSSFKISNLTGTDAASEVGFTLIKGTVFNEVRSPQSSTEGLTVRTGNTVAGVRGTTYTVSLRATDGFTVRTLEGSVFLDKVLARIENDKNASLVGEQQTVGAGEGASTTREGVYNLSMADFTKAELEYIKDNPDDFPPDMVSEAQTLLDNWVETTTSEEGNNQIVYETTTTTTTTTSGGGGGGGDGGTPVDTNPPITTTGPALVSATHNYDSGTGDITITFTFNMAINTNSEATIVDADSGSPIASGIMQSALGDTLTVIISNNAMYSVKITGFSQVTSAATSAACTSVPTQNTPAGGPYKPGHINIFTETELRKLGESPSNPDYPLSATYALQADITLTGSWTPIGNSGTQFTGTFKGNGHKISGLNITNAYGSAYQGFFGRVNGSGGVLCVIENLTVAGSINIFGYSAQIMLGGIVGEAYSGTTITGCHSEVAINISSTSGDVYAGGVVGYAYGSNAINEKIEIRGCTSSAAVTANTTASNEIYAGGIAGYASISGGNPNVARIENCNSSSAVSVTAGTNSRSAYAGGIAGYNNTAMSQCGNSGSVTASNSNNVGYFGAYAGGVAGLAENSIDNCFSTASSVQATAYGSAYAGGIAGHFLSGSIVGCTGRGNITATVTSASSGSGYNAYAGGIAGRSNDLINRCSVSGSSNTISTSGGDNAFVGGIAGLGNSSCAISECFVSGGTIRANTAAGRDYAGGAIGYQDNGLDVDNCYVWNANITSTTANGMTGGIAGNFMGAVSKVLANCYVAGVNLTANGNGSIGGIAGNASSNIISCVAYSGSITGGYNKGRICSDSTYSSGLNNFGETSFAGNTWGTSDATGPDGADELQANMDQNWWNETPSVIWNPSYKWDFTNTPIWVWNGSANLPTLLNTP